MRVHSVLALAIALLLGGTALARPSALTPSQAASLQEHVDTGDQAFQQGRFVDALVEYTTALSISPLPDLVWNIARCHEEGGDLEQAAAFFERYRSLEISAEDRAAADAKLLALAERVTEGNRGTLHVNAGAADAAVVIDGRPVGTGLELDAVLPPGEHIVEVRAPGMRPWRGAVTIPPGGDAAVQATLEELPPETGTLVVLCDVPGAVVDLPGGTSAHPGDRVTLPVGPVEVEVRAPGHAPVRASATVVAGQRETLRVEPAPLVTTNAAVEEAPAGPWRWVTLGTGLALMATAGVLHGLAASDYDQVLGATIEDGAYVSITQVDAAAARDAGDSKLVAAQGLYGAGGAMLTTSLILFIVGE